MYTKSIMELQDLAAFLIHEEYWIVLEQDVLNYNLILQGYLRLIFYQAVNLLLH